jgi:hypothetical protein
VCVCPGVRAVAWDMPRVQMLDPPCVRVYVYQASLMM